MAFTLEQVVPWGRSFDEYVRMFDLTEEDLASTILGCGDGPASFNAEASARGVRVTSCDPLYAFTASAIRERIRETREQVVEQTRRNMDQFVWDEFSSIEELAERRHDAMAAFLADLDRGTAQGRYVEAALPELPFEDGSFDLALCSHFLFLYSDQLTTDFHLEALDELCRVASEVRVFPLLALNGESSVHLDAAVRHLSNQGFDVESVAVPYEFQRGANAMMRIRPPA